MFHRMSKNTSIELRIIIHYKHRYGQLHRTCGPIIRETIGRYHIINNSRGSAHYCHAYSQVFFKKNTMIITFSCKLKVDHLVAYYDIISMTSFQMSQLAYTTLQRWWKCNSGKKNIKLWRGISIQGFSTK